jgi:hypothetical protein
MDPIYNQMAHAGKDASMNSMVQESLHKASNNRAATSIQSQTRAVSSHTDRLSRAILNR